MKRRLNKTLFKKLELLSAVIWLKEKNNLLNIKRTLFELFQNRLKSCNETKLWILKHIGCSYSLKHLGYSLHSFVFAYLFSNGFRIVYNSEKEQLNAVQISSKILNGGQNGFNW